MPSVKGSKMCRMLAEIGSKTLEAWVRKGNRKLHVQGSNV